MSVQRVSFYLVLVLVSVAFVVLMLPFYSAILWAVALAIVFYPLHVRIERAFGGRRSLAAVCSVLICVCLVIIPGMIIIGSIARHASTIYGRIESGEIDLRALWLSLQASLPGVAQDWIRTLQENGLQDLWQRVSSAGMQGGGFLASRAVTFGQSTLQVFIAFGLMLYLLFFLFRDGRGLARTLRRALPLSDSHTQQFSAKFLSVVRATVRGNVIIAALQGLIGGIAFWALGIEAALLWGVLMAFLSLLPAVGAAIVWVPAAIYLALTGSATKAIILVAVGVLVIGLVDNLLRPPLVGKETKLPDYVVLMSTVGGIALIGINGFIIGPLIAALFFVAWSIVMDEQSRQKTDGSLIL
ncbi:AI-2E family transporter [Rhizobium sp. YIM 134829]|uniref:AI-2E family transporter n=1 Tax=Rhizobium sp. YIM 134829 TaxID=3390453 RepID=UPI0039794D4F